MKNKLAIFDLDGTLFDTVPANFAAYERVLRKYGFSLDYHETLKGPGQGICFRLES